MEAPVAGLTVEALADRLGPSYRRYSGVERARHLELLQQVQRPGDVAMDARPGRDGRWSVTICTADSVGILSIIAGLFTAHHCDILRADIFTVHAPRRDGPAGPLRRRPPGRSQVPLGRWVLDVFDVRPRTSNPAALWPELRAELDRLVGLITNDDEPAARDWVADRVSEALRAASDRAHRLLPVSVEIANTPGEPATRLDIRSADTPGFLFAFTNAVAGITVNIERAEIRTVRGAARDSFWVTDLTGQPVVSEARIQELRLATALVKQFTHLLPSAPNPGQALRQFLGLVRQVLSRPDWMAGLRALEVPSVLETLAELMGESRFLWEDFLRLQHENLFPILADVPALDEQRPEAVLTVDLAQQLRAAPSRAAQVDALNAFKDREMFRIDLRHITRRIDFQQFSAELTVLAEVVVEAAAESAHTAVQARFGRPQLDAGRPCGWAVGALGKFGGCELGFASDLELIVVFEGEGLTSGPVRVTNAEYFGAFVQELLSVVRARQEGIFEIDLRLRPYGKAGPLATSIGGLARYYSAAGDHQPFERLALVKLRPVAGDRALGGRALAVRDAFVYSGAPLDLENLRHLRCRQAAELVPSGCVSAKYSRGGLVDVEYFVQAAQIVVGAAEPGVRVTNTLDAVERLEAAGHLRSVQARELRETYIFLRRLIDALRVVRGNAKDLTIPPAGSRELAYLTQRLRRSSAEDLQREIDDRMAFARGLWEAERAT